MDICRLCLEESDSMISMSNSTTVLVFHKEETVQYTTLFTFCCQIPTHDNEELLSQCLCTECSQGLVQSYKLIKTAQKTNRTFMKIVQHTKKRILNEDTSQQEFEGTEFPTALKRLKVDSVASISNKQDFCEMKAIQEKMQVVLDVVNKKIDVLLKKDSKPSTSASEHILGGPSFGYHHDFPVEQKYSEMLMERSFSGAKNLSVSLLTIIFRSL